MKRFFSIEDSNTNSAIIMETETNMHFETLIRGEGETDENQEEFLNRVGMRLDYLNTKY
jgi:hypothetical protein